MELLEAVKKVLEWHDEDAWDNVQRESAIDDLREAYEAAQQGVQSDADCACHEPKPELRYFDVLLCSACKSPRR